MRHVKDPRPWGASEERGGLVRGASHRCERTATARRGDDAARPTDLGRAAQARDVHRREAGRGHAVEREVDAVEEAVVVGVVRRAVPALDGGVAIGESAKPRWRDGGRRGGTAGRRRHGGRTDSRSMVPAERAARRRRRDTASFRWDVARNASHQNRQTRTSIENAKTPHVGLEKIDCRAACERDGAGPRDHDARELGLVLHRDARVARAHDQIAAAARLAHPERRPRVGRVRCFLASRRSAGRATRRGGGGGGCGRDRWWRRAFPTTRRAVTWAA